MNVLVLYSGGVDSSGALYKYVKEHPEYSFHILHFMTGHALNRSIPQRISVHRNLNLLKGYFPNTNFELHTPFIFFDAIKYLTECCDIYFYRMFSSMLAFRSKNITFDCVINGATKTDNIDHKINCSIDGDDYETGEERWDIGRKIWNVMKMNREHINTEIHRPCVDMMKLEIIEYMPKEYSLNTFSCQNPIRNGKMMFSHCLYCTSCEELMAINAFSTGKMNMDMLLDNSESDLIKKEFTFHDY